MASWTHSGGAAERERLSERQGSVLRALVAAYVGDALPVGSVTLSQLLSERLSSASVRNTLAELAERGLVEKPHASAGRIPTEKGIRYFVDELLGPRELASYERQTITRRFDLAASGDVVDPGSLASLASELLSTETSQLGFVVVPRFEEMALAHIHFARLSGNRVLAILVSAAGHSEQRLLDGSGYRQEELDRMTRALNERIAGRSLAAVRAALEEELRGLRSRAGDLLQRALALGLAAVSDGFAPTSELVIATRLALLTQPEFSEPDRVRELFEALETSEQLVDLLGRVVEAGTRPSADAWGHVVSVALGEELEEAGLRRCAVVAAPYGGEGSSGGVLGVIGPHRMDYNRVIPLVGYCSQLVSEKLQA